MVHWSRNAGQRQDARVTAEKIVALAGVRGLAELKKIASYKSDGSRRV
jgi:hypothetical protein